MDTTMTKNNIKDKCVQCTLFGCPYRLSDYKEWTSRLKRTDGHAIHDCPPQHYDITCTCKRCIAWRNKVKLITDCVDFCKDKLQITRKCYDDPGCKCVIHFINGSEEITKDVLKRQKTELKNYIKELEYLNYIKEKANHPELLHPDSKECIIYVELPVKRSGVGLLQIKVVLYTTSIDSALNKAREIYKEATKVEIMEVRDASYYTQ